MRFTALLLIIALLLKSVAGFAMTSCHSGHHPVQPAVEQSKNPSTAAQFNSVAAVNNAEHSSTAPQNSLTDTLSAEATATTDISSCNLCASCCLASTMAIDQTPARLASIAGSIPSPDFVDLSVLLSRKTQPPKFL